MQNFPQFLLWKFKVNINWNLSIRYLYFKQMDAQFSNNENKIFKEKTVNPYF